MKLLLSSDRELLPVVDAVELLARHCVERDERPVMVDDGGWQVVPDPQQRPAANIALVIKERLWSGRIRQAAVDGMLRLHGADGFRIECDPDTFACDAFVKPADLAQWLADAYAKDVLLDGVLVKPTPAPAEREILKRELLVAQLVDIWPSIGADLQEGSRNGLMAAAGGTQYGHGYYDVQRALAWARTNGRLRGSRTPTPLNDLPGKVNRFF